MKQTKGDLKMRIYFFCALWVALSLFGCAPFGTVKSEEAFKVTDNTEYKKSRNPEWCISQSSTTFSVLDFPTRYDILHLNWVKRDLADGEYIQIVDDKDMDLFKYKPTSIRLIREGKFIEPLQSYIEIASTSSFSFEGKELGVFGYGTQSQPLCGQYTLQGLDENMLINLPFGGKSPLQYIEFSDNRSIPISDMDEPQFVRVCIDSIEKETFTSQDIHTSGRIHAPHISFQVDGNKLQLPSNNKNLYIQKGCVDFVGKKIDAVLVTAHPYDENDPLPQEVYRVRGNSYLAPLRVVQKQIDTNQGVSSDPPMKDGKFIARWSTFLPSLKLVNDLDKPRIYSVSVAERETVRPNEYFSIALTYNKNEKDLHVNILDGDGFETVTKDIELQHTSWHGNYTLHGIDESSFQKRSLTFMGVPKHQNDRKPNHYLGNFKQAPQFARVCANLIPGSPMPPLQEGYPNVPVSARINITGSEWPIYVPAGSCADLVGTEFYGGVAKSNFDKEVYLNVDFYFRSLN